MNFENQSRMHVSKRADKCHGAYHGLQDAGLPYSRCISTALPVEFDLSASAHALNGVVDLSYGNMGSPATIQSDCIKQSREV